MSGVRDVAHVEARLRRAEHVLTKVSEGNLDQRLELGAEEDALSGLEMGINFLIVDLRTTELERREERDALAAQRDDLEAKLETIEQQAAATRGLTAPVMEIWDGVLVLPIVDVADPRWSMDILTSLLENIVARRARCVILDLTGVETVGSHTAEHLVKVVRAARLLGARCVLTGLGPAVALTLVESGVDLAEVRTLRNVKAGLLDCLRFLDGGRGGERGAVTRGAPERPQGPRSIPIIRLDGALLVSMPVALSQQLVLDLKDDIAQGIRAHDARGLVVDVSGVDPFDSFVASAIQGLSTVARLMGVRTVLAGIDVEMAITIVELGLARGDMETALDVESALWKLGRRGGADARDADLALSFVGGET